MPWNIVKVWEGTTTSGLFERSSRGSSYGAYSSESKKRGRGQDKGESQKVETCKREEEK